MMKKISIIVPIYNVEGYLSECIDSLLHQDVVDYEIILVNDGSTDTSKEIAEKYEDEYSGLIKLLNKENGGLSDARNVGLQHVNGKYILFVDSDDKFEENSLSGLYEYAEEKDADIIVFDFIKEYERQGKSVWEKSMRSSDVGEYILSTPNACNKMYRASMFKDNKVMFKKGIWYEDLALIPGLVAFTNKISHYNKGLYHYRMRDESIMRQMKYNSKFLDILDVIDILGERIRIDYYEELEYLAILHAYYGCSLRLLAFDKYEDIEKCKSYLDHNFPNWKKNAYFEKRNFLFKYYCELLYKKKYNFCKVLVKLKEIFKDV